MHPAASYSFSQSMSPQAQPVVGGLRPMQAYYYPNPSSQPRTQFVHQVASPIIMAGSPNSSGTVFYAAIPGVSPIASPQHPRKANA